MAGFYNGESSQLETLIKATAWMISLRDYLPEFWYPQALRTKGKGNSESFQGLNKSRRNPRGPGRGQGHQEEVWSSRSHADRQGRVTGVDGWVG